MAEADIDIGRIISAVNDAASLAMVDWREGAAPDAQVWEKTKGQPVSDIDMAVDALLKQRLMEIVPDAGWLSEETADNADRLSSRLLWCVDPIDGTRDYVGGRTGWCVSVGLVADGLPYLGILSAPARGQIWVAKAGEGASCNGAALRSSQRSIFAGSRIPADYLPNQDRDMEMVDKPNSIAMRMTMIACDRADIIATLRWGHEWDVAASHLVAQESGAIVTDAFGGKLRYNKPNPLDFGLICCAPDLHDAAVERLSKRAASISKAD